MQFICQECQKQFEAKGKNRKFCSLSCSCKHRNRTLDTKECWRRKYGDTWVERYAQWKQKMSDVTSGEKNPMFGHHDHVHGLKRYARDKTGKTLEEIHGFQKACDLRSRLSLAQQGELNPAFGKVYENGGKSLKGYYKGHFFRSLLEYSFMKHLENKNVDLENDVLYESFRIPFSFKGRPRTYTIDFYVKSEGVVYEVKPFYALKNELNQSKFEAAQLFFKACDLEFRVVTEQDFVKISFEEAYLDADVTWKEKTFRYFRAYHEKTTNNRD